jgi:hypothetical protein
LFRGAALLIGLWDLFVHLTVLCALIFMFRQAPKVTNDVVPINDPFINPQPPLLPESNAEKSSDVLTKNKNFLSSNILLKRILEKHNVTRMPMGLNTRNFYSNLDLMTIKWAASLNKRMSTLFSIYESFFSLNLFSRRQMRCIFRCFLSNNSHFGSYLWYLNCKFSVILIITLIQQSAFVEQTIIYSSILFNQSFQCHCFNFIIVGFLCLHA